MVTLFKSNPKDLPERKHCWAFFKVLQCTGSTEGDPTIIIEVLRLHKQHTGESKSKTENQKQKTKLQKQTRVIFFFFISQEMKNEQGKRDVMLTVRCEPREW